MDQSENYRENERIFDNGKLAPGEPGSGFLLTIFVVAAIALLAWGIGYVEVKPYVSTSTVSELPISPEPTPLPAPTLAVPNT
jgi:hypothetical protein